jgi:amino acid adenylation domain-containing protein
LTGALVAMGEARGVSLYATLLAAFQVFLARWTGQDEVIVGSPVAGRNHPGLEGTVGYLVNMLPMRAGIADDPRFDEFLARVRRTVAEGLEHQDLPFSLMVDRLQVRPDPGRPPIFQVMYAHQRSQRLDGQGLAPFALGVPGAQLDLPGLPVESVALDRQSALFELSLMTARDGDRLRLAWEYSTDLFDSETIARISRHFLALLERILADPHRRLSSLPMIGDEERRQVLAHGAGHGVESLGVRCVHRLFEAQAKRTPDAVAVECGGRSLTYRQLNERANRLARELRARGVGPDVLVGVGMTRSPDLAVGLLGVLKAGGAFVPLDPDYPPERLVGMLEDSRPGVLLTQEHLQGRWPATRAQVIRLDADWEAVARHAASDLDAGPMPEDAAYVIYTSGSTGEPRGVVVRHVGLVNHNLAVAAMFDLSPADRVLQFSSLSFDIAIEELFPTWIRGAVVVFRDEQADLGPSAFSGWVKRKRITVLDLPTVYWHVWVEGVAGLREQLPGSLRLVVVGGEKASARRFADWCAIGGDRIRWINTYGPTEATVIATAFEPQDGRWSGAALLELPIGRPIANTRVYVLDNRMDLVPLGLPGELYIGGDGVARCYLHRPGPTAERFVPDPFGNRPGARLFRTGDRARWRPDGQLEFLGRVDHQVKIRGFRVEPGEVEAAIAHHPAVKQAVVVSREDARGDHMLAAYFVPAGAESITTSELRRWLKDRLPEAMVPSWLIALASLPLSSNGKVDHSALPPPGEDADAATSQDYAPPRTVAERILAVVAAELLERDRVGIHDDFFELGVDSILGIRLVSRARQAGLILDPAHLFRYPTIAELATAAASNGESRDTSPAPPRAVAPFELVPEGIDLEAVRHDLTEHGGVEDLYPLTPVQEGMLFHTLDDPEAGHYVEQFLCRLRGDLDRSALQESWHRLVARHPTLRSTIHWTEFDRPCQVVHRLVEVPADYQDWRGLSPLEQDERLESYLYADQRRGFDPSRPPLSRLALLRLGEDVHQLVWSIHHVMIDGWCLSVLLREMLDIYQAIRSGREPVLAPSRPFRDYVAWLDGRDEEGAEAYWRQVLSGLTAATTLELDRRASDSRAEAPEGIEERQILLSAAMTAALQAVARSRRLTLSTLIHGAWALLLSRYSGRDDVLFGITVSGRPPELAGIESMVGMFINVLPLRVAVDEELRLVPWLHELQADVIELRRFEAIPLARIQTWSEVPAGTPLFESIVTVENLPFIASLQESAGRLGIDSVRNLERAHYPIALTILPGTELTLKISFAAGRFDPDAIARVLGQLRTLVEAMAVDPERRLGELPWMMDSEQEQLIASWGRPPEEAPSGEADLDQLSEEELDALIDRLR